MENLKKNTIKEYLYNAAPKYNKDPIIKINLNNTIISKTYDAFINDVELFGSKIFCNKKHIALIGPVSYEWLVVFFGGMNSGNVIVPIDFNLSSEIIEELLIKADINMIFYDKQFKSKIEKLKEKNRYSIYELNNLNDFIKGINKKSLTSFEPEEDDTAIIAFTSGTTGFNKAVMLTHKNLVHNAICSVLLIGKDKFQPGDITVCILPLYHMLGITTTVLVPLLYGVTIGLPNNSIDFISNLKIFKPAYIVGVPMIAEGILKYLKAISKKYNYEIAEEKIIRNILGENLKLFISGGAHIEERIIIEYEKLGITLLNGYGITECSPVVSCNNIEKRKKDSVGVIAPKPFCEAKIHKGEIYIRGSIVCKGYYKDEESNNINFDGEWFKTGDLGYIDNEGFLYITGRKKNIIILKDGNNISPEQIEKMINEHYIVSNSLIKAEKLKNIELIKAYIYPDYNYAEEKGIKDIKMELSKIINEINSKLPNYMKVQEIEILEENFELTGIGKIKRYMYL
ncbi:MAG: long-chain fatty acid--CoA ligase [Clostridiales bacterium]|nr:long-chain fatty acid--CoA ligase [Clostridiales bacterium]